MVGVNDAMLFDAASSSVNEFDVSLDKLAAKARKMTDRVVISTIIPVEKSKPLDDAYFDQEKTDVINSLIQEQSSKHQIGFLQIDRAFSQLNEPYTTDGVHLNRQGCELVRTAIDEALWPKSSK